MLSGQEGDPEECGAQSTVMRGCSTDSLRSGPVWAREGHEALLFSPLLSQDTPVGQGSGTNSGVALPSGRSFRPPLLKRCLDAWLRGSL